ncbi:MAG: CRISPR-associated helicase Cas3' [Oscillospiraceae bacterium]|jgi:CRISPR-associated endonuclease/helicase Cas3|nr:CRISPR-associated helicase Cas3' [Oscillospiraceae bacterium]
MEKKRPFAAHIREDGTVQTVAEHLKNVAELAKRFAEPFGAGDMAYQCGLAHDIGKYTSGFQHRIWENGGKVDHSTAGAKEILSLCGAPAAYCIAGHHAGLMDGGGQADSETAGTLHGRINKKINDEYKIYKNEVPLRKPQLPKLQMLGQRGFTVSFFTRMLFSCLVDADFLDTEAFMQAGKVRRGGRCGTETLSRKLDDFLNAKHWLDAKEGLNGRRSEILKACIDTGEKSGKGLFTLTVPTGGGKTVSSLAFALHHAENHGMKRVIYVIPYCSIIEQTADVFSGILGKENVLAHYSGAKYDDEGEEMTLQRLAAENWDTPVIVTTAVQFFESLFSNRTSACRKLHNIADSVVIFDEAQTLPLPYLKPCVDAIAELTVNYGTTCVLCTATQPALGKFFQKYAPALEAKEICPDTQALYRAFRRVHYEQLGTLTDEELAQRLNECRQVLCIVSTRKQAKNVFGLLKPEGSFHLSTLMTPEHRRAVLKEVRERLKNGRPCRVISTSLIEAGVDVDFPTVYRAYAGLDSEIQAGGRCNRENRRSVKDSVVFLFKPESKYKLPGSMRRPAEEAYSVTRGRKDVDSPEAVTEYFKRLYNDTGSAVDWKDIVKSFEDGGRSLSFPFQTAARNFCIIENNTWTVRVPRGDRSRKIAALFDQPGFKPNRKIFREMGQYCVSVYEDHFKELSPSLHIIGEKLAALTVPELYNKNTGLSFKNDGGYGLFT